MPLITQSIDNLLGGVSQAAPSDREPNEVFEQVNCLTHPRLGVVKRPPSVQQGTIFGAQGSTVFQHNVTHDIVNRYRLYVTTAGITVKNMVTGALVPVIYPDGLAYLAAATSPKDDLRAVTLDGDTFIANRKVVVKTGTLKSPPLKEEALVSIREADFATTYSITLNGRQVSYTTPPGNNPNDRKAISTDSIANQLSLAITTDSSLSSFLVTQYGSTLHIARTANAAFTISASDGLSDIGILAIKGTVQRFTDLPDRAKNGFIVEVTGDPTTAYDNYFVKYSDMGAPSLAGVWKETVRPGILNTLDNATMPWLLSMSGTALEATKAMGIPSGPTVMDSNTVTNYAGWTKRQDSGASEAGGPFSALDPTLVTTLHHHQEAVSSILSTLNGGQSTVKVNYDANTTGMMPGASVDMELWISNYASTGNIPSGSFTKVVSRRYKQGQTLYGESMEYKTTAAANTQVMLKLSYPEGTVLNQSIVPKLANMRLRQLTSDATSSIVITGTTGKVVQFDQTTVYPEGTVVTATTDGTALGYTLSTDKTGDVVANDMVSFGLFSGATATSNEAGRITVTKTGSVPTISVSVSFDTARRLYNPDLNLVPGSLNGLTFKNLSDGSQATINANTATQIVLSANLTGGTANVIAVGDVATVEGAATSFTFRKAQWKARPVGDLDTNPFPSIVSRTISDIFYFRGRLGLLSGTSVTLSKAADRLQLFRTTVTQLLSDDTIDITSAYESASHWHSALTLGGELMLWSDQGQYTVTGEPALTPETIAIRPVSVYANVPTVRPFVSGSSIYFAQAQATGAPLKIFRYSLSDGGQVQTAATDITQKVPLYLQGAPIQIVADDTIGFIAVRTTYLPNQLYVCTLVPDGRSVTPAWSIWQLVGGASIISMDMAEGVLAMAVERSGTVYIETMDVKGSGELLTGAYLDGRTGAPGAYTGTIYSSRVDLSTIHFRPAQRYGNTKSDTTGQLLLRNLTVRHHKTGGLDVFVNGKTYSHDSATDTPREEALRVPVMQRNTETFISISNESAEGFRISGIDWDGTYIPRATMV